MKKVTILCIVALVFVAFARITSTIDLGNGIVGTSAQDEWYGTAFPTIWNNAVYDIDTLYSRVSGRSPIDTMRIISNGRDTIKLSSPMWDDMEPFQLGAARNIGQTGAPTLTARGDGFSDYVWRLNDSLIGKVELTHRFIENDTSHIHLHYSPVRKDAAQKYVKFSIHIKTRNVGDTLTYDTTFTKEDTIPANTPKLKYKILEIAEFKTPNMRVGSMSDVCVKIVAPSSASDTIGVYIDQVGIHRKVNSLGSRTETTK